MHPVRIARHFGRLALQRAFPTPEEAAWRRLIDYAETAEPGKTAHRLRVLDLDLEFPDPSALASQWHDTFVRETLAVTFETDAPRVLDCGAHVGLVSLWIKRRWPAARITAFEPDPEIAAMLRRNLQRNNAADVEVVEAAAWKAAGTVTFLATATDAGAIDDVAAGAGGRACQVAAVRLRDWLHEPVDLLKLDIEGAELDVLDDSGEALSSVRRVHLEVHDFDTRRRLLPRCLLQLEAADFTYALSNLGSAVWRDGVGPSGPFAQAVPSWVVCVRAWRPEQ
jgi:FkbM family methyltransferase